MADCWPDDVRLSDLESRFVRQACGKRGADVRPDFNWDKTPVKAMGYLCSASVGKPAGRDRAEGEGEMYPQPN
jgi:hypothetical protein